MKKNIKKLISALVLLLIAIVLVYSGVRNYRSSITFEKFEGSPEKLSIGVVSDTSSLVLIAQDQNFFEHNGVDIEIIKYQAGATALNDLFEGKIDMAVGSDYAGARTAFSRDDFRILTSVSKTSAYEIVARRDFGIISPSDIKGKKIGVTKGTAGEYWLGIFLTYNNLSTNDIEIVDMSPQAVSDAMIIGEIDAMLNLEPHTFNVKKALPEKTVSWHGQRGQGIYSLTYIKGELVQEKGQVLERFLRALVMAEDYFNKNKSDSYEFIADYFDYESDYLDKVIKTKYDFMISLEQALILTLEDEARWLIANGLTDKKDLPNFLNFFYFDALKKVNPEKVGIIN
jgi:ABC-type nitrate/sulfonate/bicarbonate transport system substrate-binding protein